jgi:hypothetical protein
LAREIEGALPPETGAVAKPALSVNDPARASRHQLLEHRSAETEAEAHRLAALSETERFRENDDGRDVQDDLTRAEVGQGKNTASTETPISSVYPSASQPQRPNDHQDALTFMSGVSVPASADECVSRRELAALDAENTLLKALLGQRLRDDNIRLKQMLARFLG